LPNRIFDISGQEVKNMFKGEIMLRVLNRQPSRWNAVT